MDKKLRNRILNVMMEHALKGVEVPILYVGMNEYHQLSIEIDKHGRYPLKVIGNGITIYEQFEVVRVQEESFLGFGWKE